ncbi:MAG: beta-N-acetylhexosaminidase [Pirellulales bacterium]|nr:beta-N-acetylhexosaminidase [Pirellulales bacterium]
MTTAFAAEKSVAPAVIPLPVRCETAEGEFLFDAQTAIVTDAASRETARQLAACLEPATGLNFKITETAGSDGNVIVLKQDSGLKNLGTEGYRLEVTPRQVALTAPTQAGLFYAVQTLRQLLPPQIFSSQPVKNVVWKIPCVKIEDYPRFVWRGLMLDSGHDFQNLPFVYRFIDFMALHKFNTLHWHLPDLGTWPLEIKKYPKLLDASTRGPGVKQGHYTQDQVRKVVQYAAERHITVVPEIDMPGHSTPALLAYPELNCPIPQEGRPWQYCVGNEKTYEFLEYVLTEVLDLFPSKFIHIGGDECPKDRWQQCPLCQAKMKAENLKDGNELQSYFIKRIEKFLNSKGRRLIGWDEILEGGLAPNAAVMSWRGMQGGIEAAKTDHDVVMAPTTYTYFDYPQTADGQSDPGANNGAPVTLDTVYGFEPVPKELTSAQAAHVLGAQAQSWSDRHPTEPQIEALVYPRACALIEVLWSPKQSRQYAAFFQRLQQHEERLKALGVHSRPLSTIPQPAAK